MDDGTFNPNVHNLSDALNYCISAGDCFDGVVFYTQLAKNNIMVLNDAMDFAAYLNYGKIVRYLINNGANDLDAGLCGAAEGGHLRLVKFFIRHGSRNFDDGILFAMQGSDIKRGLAIINFLITKGADLNEGLYHAAIYGKMHFINEGLYHAAIYGKMHFINFFIAKGSTSLNRGLCGAANGGHLNIVHFFIDKGADSFQEALEEAVCNNRTAVVDFLRQKLGMRLDFIDYTGSDICSICYNTEDTVLIASQCNHVFHRECIDLWISDDHMMCPVCRRNLLS